MAEFQSQVVPALSLFISALAFVFALIKYNKQKASLKIKVLNCTHVYKIANITKERELRFYASFRITNIGDQRTKLHSVSLDIISEGKHHRLNTAIPVLSEVPTTPNPEPQIWLEGRDIIQLRTYSAKLWNNKEQAKIECAFLFLHTDNEVRVKTISVMKTKPPNILDEYFDKLP
jgi:hypothetical protein